jgi:hypothetical protein
MNNRPLTHSHPDFSHVPPEGLRINVMETSSGIKGLGSIELGRNRYDPSLTLYETQLEMNVVRIKHKPYDQIERIILLPKRKPYAVRLYFLHDSYTFSMTILDRDLLLKVYHFILGKMESCV